MNGKKTFAKNRFQKFYSPIHPDSSSDSIESKSNGDGGNFSPSEQAHSTKPELNVQLTSIKNTLFWVPKLFFCHKMSSTSQRSIPVEYSDIDILILKISSISWNSVFDGKQGAWKWAAAIEGKRIFPTPCDIDMWLASMTVIIFVNNTKQENLQQC